MNVCVINLDIFRLKYGATNMVILIYIEVTALVVCTSSPTTYSSTFRCSMNLKSSFRIYEGTFYQILSILYHCQITGQPLKNWVDHALLLML